VSFRHVEKGHPVTVHEVGITQSILEIAVDHARQAGAAKITALTVEIGALSGVIPEAVEFCFEAVAKESMAEGATLTIVRIPGQGRCLDCGQTLEMDTYTFSCPHCESFNIERLQGDELRLTEVEID